MVQGLEAQVTSAIMPTFKICASICPKPGVQNALTSIRRDQQSRRTHHRIDHIAVPQCKLFHAAIDAGADDGFLQLYFRLRQRRFGTGLLRRQQGGDTLLGLLFCGRHGGNGALATLESDLELFDVAKGNVTRIAALQFSLGLRVRPRSAARQLLAS